MDVSDDELKKMEKQIVETLPILLERKPSVKMVIYEILSKEFTTRTELTDLIKSLRDISNDLRNSNIRIEDNLKNQFVVIQNQGEQLKNQSMDIKDIKTELKDHGEQLKSQSIDIKDIKTELKDHGEKFVGLEKGIGTIGRKIGEDFEKIVKKIYIEFLSNQGIDFKKIERRKKFEFENKKFEIDLYSQNDIINIFEVKYSAVIEDASELVDKIQILKKIYPSKKIHAFLIAVNLLDDIEDYCEQNNIKLIKN